MAHAANNSHIESVPLVRLTFVVVCLVVPAVARAADGSVDVYLQPSPAEAARLTFAVGSISAISVNGSESPLKLNLKLVGSRETQRQRLLASGRLKPGNYAGFIFTVKRAALKGEHGETALAVPDAPQRIDFPFAIAPQQGWVVWLTLKYPDSTTEGTDFRPVFSATMPPRPIVDHAGFVTNSGSDTITVFDKSLTQAVAAIATCAGPAGMALDRNRRRVYVACSKDDEVQAIDVATREMVERSSLSPGDRPQELALTPDGLTLISVNTGSNSVSFFDALSLARQERVTVGSGPGSLLIDPTGRRAFVFNTLSSSMTVIDLQGRSVAATISTESAPLRGQFNRRGDRLYVIHERSPYITVLDARQLTVIARARLRTGISALVVDPIRDLLCVGGNDPLVEFYDPNALMPLYSMRTSAGVSYLAIDAEDNRLYMVSPSARGLLVAGLPDRKPVSEIDVGESPYWVVVMGEK